MSDINFLFGALRYFFNVIWGALIVIGWFTLGVILLGVIWFILDRIQLRQIRRHINRKRIRIVDGR